MKIYDSASFPEALNSRNMVVAFFFMKSCEFCYKFSKIFEKYGGMSGIDMVAVDISDQTSPLWNQYRITRVPALVIFRKGAPVLRVNAREGIGLKESDLDGAIAKAMNPLIETK